MFQVGHFFKSKSLVSLLKGPPSPFDICFRVGSKLLIA